MARTPTTPNQNDVEADTVLEPEKTEEKKAAKPPRLVYIGPNLPSGQLVQYQVFKGGLPPHCNALFGKIPEAKELFVPASDLAGAKIRAATPGTNEARLFEAVVKATEKGGA